MAFNINAQIILKAPKDIGKISKSIQSQLSKAGNINIGVNKNLNSTLNGINKSLGGLTKGIQKLNATSTKTANALQRLNTLNAVTSVSSKKLANTQNNLASSNARVAKSANQAAGGLQAFGKQAAASLRSAAAFAVTTRAVFGLTSAIKSGVRDALEFERSLIKISQVTGDSVSRLGELKETVVGLSTSLGINANELVEVGRTLAQTGQTAKQVQQSLDALAKSTLAPTFGDIKQTTEGLIASLAQFNIQASQSEEVLASLNAVSKRFAVESEDLISAIRRAGGVFSTAATDAREPIEALQQLSAIFTSVRSVTRESAETIATGLRTIFTRIQRRGTIDFLKQFGVELVNAEGNFVGLFEAFKRLSAGLDEIIQKGDALTLSAITEELGGVRQVGKLIPAITNFANAQKALEVAQKGAAEGLTGDVDKALGGLAKRFEQTQAKFQELIRSISESGTFQNLAKLALNTADAFISLADKLKPLLPLIATVGASFIAKGATQFAGGFLGAIGGGGLRNVGSTLGGGGGKGAPAQGVNQNTQAINQNTLVTNQLSNIFQSVDAGLDSLNRQLASLTKTLTTQVSNLIQAVGGFPTRASGGAIPKFANGGRVYGPSHAAGGVIAELEGGEYVIPKKFAVGGTVRRKIKNMRGKKHGFVPSVTQIDSKTGESLGLGEDFFSVKTATEFVEISRDEYDKTIRGTGGGSWEGYITSLRKYGTYQGANNFPVDYVKGNDLYDAKNFPKERQAETLFDNGDAGGKALNYLLYESFKNLGYNYQKPRGNKLTVDARSAKFLNKRITPGEDNFSSNSTITFLFPKIVDEVQKAAGGFIQALVEGGIAEVNNIGAAVFDAEGAGLKDVKKGFNVNGQDKLYTLVRDELDASIKEGFISAVDDGLVNAAQSTLNKLGSDATVDRGSYLGIINQGQRGSLFEDTLRALQTEGKFSGLFETGDNFDFTTGLGSTANLFGKFSPDDPLYVDARKSANAAEPGPLFKKLENELRRQGNSVSEGSQPLSDEEKKALNRLQKRAASGVLPKKGLERLESLEKRANLATGGMVPVRISNGEMVVSDPREVASRKSELQSINKLSTGGFASGYIAKGPGSGTSDSIYTSLPEGAFVVNAASTRKYLGLRNGGRVGRPRFANGGETGGIVDARFGAIGDQLIKEEKKAAEALTDLGETSEKVAGAQEQAGNETKKREQLDAQTALLRQQSFQQLAGAASAATAAFATFDLSNPLASITSLGFAAFEATSTLQTLKDADQDIGSFGESLLSFKNDFQGGLTDAFSPSRIKEGGLTGKKGDRFGIKGAGIGKIAGRAAAGGAAAAAVAAAVGPVVDSITDAFAGAKQEIEGFSGREGATGGEAQILGGIGEGLKGAAAGAAAGLVFGPVGAAIGGVIGGAGAAIIGSIEAGLQQEAFNALKSLKQASEDAAKGLDAFNAKTDVTSSDIDEVNKRLSNLTADIGPTLEKTFTASLGLTGNLAVAAGDDPGGAVFGRSLADGIDGGDLASLFASPITAITTLGNTFQDLAASAGEFVGIGSEAGEAIAGFSTLGLSNLGTVLSTVTNFGLEMFGLDAATQAATATAESFEAVLNTIGPENIEKANEALGKSAAQFVKDLDTLGDLETIDQLANLNLDTSFASEANVEFAKLSQVLDQSASNGNKFAGALQKQLAQTSKLNVLKGVKDQIDLLIASGDKAAAADLGQAFQALQDVPVDQIQKAAFELESTGQIGTTAAEALSKLGNAERDRVLQLVQQQAAQAKANRLLQESKRSIDALAEGLNKFTNVASGAAQQFDIFTNSLTQSIDQAFSETAGGFQVERFNPFENLDISTDFDLDKAFEEFRGLSTDQGAADVAFDGLKDFAKLQRDVPFLLKDALTQSLAAGGLEETASPQQVLEKIQESLGDANIQIPDVALQSLAKNLEAQAATEQGGELPVTNIIRALEEGGDLANLFGEIGSKFQDALSGVRSAQDQVTNNLLRISDLQLKIARQEREFNLSQVKRAQAAEDRIAKIRGKAATNQLGRAQANLGAQATAIAGSADPNQLLARRQASINERNVLQTQLQTGRTASGAVASQQQQKDAADKLAVLNNEFESTTQALNLLANETDRLAAIEAEAAAAKQREQEAVSGGIGLFKKLQQEAKTGVRDTSIDEDIAPIASLQKALQGGSLGQDEALTLLDQLNSGNNDLLKVALNRAKAESPGLDEDTLISNLFTNVADRVAGLEGAKERGLGGDSGFIKDVLVQQFEDAKSESEKLASAAEGIFKQQSDILQKIFDQNKQQAVQALQQADAAFLDSVNKFDEAVQQFADLRAREADTREAQEVTTEAERQKQKVQEESTASIDQKIADESEAIVSAGLPEELERLRAQYRKNIEDARESGGNVSFFEETLADEAGLRVQAQANLEKKVQAQKADVEAKVRKEEADRVLAEQQAIEDAKNKKLAEISGRGAEREAKRKQEREARAAGTQTQTGIPTGIATPLEDLQSDLEAAEEERSRANNALLKASGEGASGIEMQFLQNDATAAADRVKEAEEKLKQAGGAAPAGAAPAGATGATVPPKLAAIIADINAGGDGSNFANFMSVTDTGALPPDLAAQVEQSVATQTTGPIRGAASGQIQPFSRVAQQAQGEIGVLQKKLEAAGGFSQEDQQKLEQLKQKRDAGEELTGKERREVRSLQQRQTFSKAIGKREGVVEQDAAKQQLGEAFKEGGKVVAQGINAGVEGLKTAAALIPETINTVLGGEVTLNLLGTQGLEDSIIEKVQQIVKEQIAPLLPNNKAPEQGQIGNTPSN